MGVIDELYREEIMEHHNNPRNFGKMVKADAAYHDYNPICGDDVEIQLKIERGRIKAAMFSGNGCAISQAAASMLTEEVKGKSLQQLERFTNEKMLQLMKIKPDPVRIKCALLALKALQKGLMIYNAKLVKK